MTEYEKIKTQSQQICKEILSRKNLLEQLLIFEPLQSGKAESLYIKDPITQKKTKMIFRITEKGKKDSRYVELTVKSTMVQKFGTPSEAEIKVDKNDAMITYISVQQSSAELESYISKIIEDNIDSFEPSERFGCCYRYRECSAAKKCLHPDQVYAKACWYRKNLEAGKIFY